MYAIRVIIKRTQKLIGHSDELDNTKMINIGIDPNAGLIATLPDNVKRRMLNATIKELAASQVNDWLKGGENGR